MRPWSMAGLAWLLATSAQAASWSPDCSQIAYSYIGGPENIYLVDVGSGVSRALVVREQRDFQPEWAADGSHLVFTGVENGVHVMMRVQPDGSGLQALSEPALAAGDPDYSPNGKQLLYFSDEPLPRDLYLRDLASYRVTALTRTSDFDETSPRWAPDGDWVVYVGKPRMDDAQGDIWIRQISTGAMRNLTNSPKVSEFHPDWAPDGRRVIYVRSDGDGFSLALYDLDQQRETIIADGHGYAVLSPHFAPDGERVAFVRTDFNEQGPNMPALMVLDLRTGRERLLSQGRYLSQVGPDHSSD